MTVLAILSSLVQYVWNFKKFESQEVKKSKSVRQEVTRTQELKKVDSQEVKKTTNVEPVVLPRYSQLVSQLVSSQISWITALRIFLIFCMNVP